MFRELIGHLTVNHFNARFRAFTEVEGRTKLSTILANSAVERYRKIWGHDISVKKVCYCATDSFGVTPTLPRSFFAMHPLSFAAQHRHMA
jgi:hypothetical protein